MTTIKSSEIKNAGYADIAAFDAAVQVYVNDFSAYRAHLDLVKEGKAQAYPAPIAKPIIDRAVLKTADGVEPNYEIDDDLPGIILFQKKNNLVAIISNLEGQANNRVSPELKRRLFGFRKMDVDARDSQRRIDAKQNVVAEYNKAVEASRPVMDKAAANSDDKSAVAAAVDASNSLTQAREGIDAEVEKRVEDGRPSEDSTFLQEHSDRASKLDAISRYAADLYAQVDDLTVHSIDAWSAKPFPH